MRDSNLLDQVACLGHLQVVALLFAQQVVGRGPGAGVGVVLCEAARTELLVAVGAVGVGVQLGCRGCTGKSKGLDGVGREVCGLGAVEQLHAESFTQARQRFPAPPGLRYVQLSRPDFSLQVGTLKNFALRLALWLEPARRRQVGERASL